MRIQQTEEVTQIPLMGDLCSQLELKTAVPGR